jgi:hypothetical protein
MAPKNEKYELEKRNSRLKRIAQMRKELRHLEGALNHIEHLVRGPRTPLAALRSVAAPFRGWTLSVVQSYVILEHVLSNSVDAKLAMGKLDSVISSAIDLYAPRVVEPDPVNFIDPYDRMDLGTQGASATAITPRDPYDRD